ncbi:expressed unknown protein [Seminavis robusta]|uniref:SnoaL-like domain-containing protein n=1 Tax=Seminavis robusta TaxID=568900 RepID=A0A9N8E9A8_9STRA|nr:expressed unknown protein [Seminavis robusta]|eukprot:Sro832_g208460.1 n/a (210) ;mRNA; r:32821-33450
MGFLFFPGGKKTEKKSGKSTKNKGGSKKQSKKPKNAADPSETIFESQFSSHSSSSSIKLTNEQLVRYYMHAKNRHATTEELLPLFHETATVKFDDQGCLTAVQLVTEIHKLYQAFEDLSFSFESVKEVRPGEVLVEQLVVSGTHTGNLIFMDLPAIPASGKHVVLDPERVWVNVEDGKIAKMDVMALGNLTGPPGLYVSVGGKLQNPCE